MTRAHRHGGVTGKAAVLLGRDFDVELGGRVRLAFTGRRNSQYRVHDGRVGA